MEKENMDGKDMKDILVIYENRFKGLNTM